MFVARCLRCHSKTELQDGVTRLEKCPYCKETIQITYYEHVYQNSNNNSKGITTEMKGGNVEMAKTKESTNTDDNTEGNVEGKPLKEKKRSITEIRIENAQKVLALLKDLGIEGKETTAVLSRAYNTFKGK